MLVGGEGTRLRPLTETIPKPLVPLMDRPFLHHVLDHLAEHGVHEVVLSSSYLEEAFLPLLHDRHGDPAVTWITEESPLDTAGAIVNALRQLGTEPFLVLNGDILTDLDLGAMVAFHRDRKAVATIAVSPVADARPFGLVEMDRDGRMLRFLEKPAELVAGEVNAGTYVLEAEAFDGFEPGVPVNIEREVFPVLIAREARVFGFRTDAYWLDLGTPAKYLQAHFDLLEGRVGARRYPAPYLAPSARVDLRARLGRWVVAGEESAVGPGAEVDESVLHRGAVVREEARVLGSILGPGSEVGPGATVTGSVLAEGARVPEGAEAREALVPPGQIAGIA